MQISDRLNLGTGFSKYFRMTAALDDASRADVFRIRHEVYCEDLKFEPEPPDRRGIDDYDAHSVHGLLRTVDHPHAPVGCTRIVLAKPGEPEAPLPFERSYAAALDRSIIDPAKLPRDRIGKISRLAVSRTCRRRKGEEHVESPMSAADFAKGGHHARFPFIPTSLLLGSVALAEQSGRRQSAQYDADRTGSRHLQPDDAGGRNFPTRRPRPPLSMLAVPDPHIAAEHLLDPVQRHAANNSVLVDEFEHPAVFRVERDVAQVDVDDVVRDTVVVAEHEVRGGVTRGESTGRA
ncbi:PEP-CTERM/exosortase system-associated acyltransferase [Aromatoleum anaerobium]|nr:PEP-CTERM/exosortase system-associated acyltransferase [Aromatoleum anaerobium]MCK0505558.1 PEP-CTERM/exosortase system-associated acyltransferase [Aromatoleum anaerobium]